MAVADVLVFADHPLKDAPALRESEPPLSTPIEVTSGVSLAGIREDAATAIIARTGFREADRAGVNAMYALVRYDPPGSKWDQDQLISKVLFLSHFVTPHDGGFELTARLETDEKRRPTKVEPADIAPPFARAYCCPGVVRKWMTQKDGESLRHLVSAYDTVLPVLKDTRLGTAVSMFAESSFVYHGRLRGQLLTTILEGLVSTSTERAVKQFVVRVPALAAEVGLAQFDGEWAAAVYKLRSKLAHGSALLGPVSDQHAEKIQDYHEKLGELDNLLRSVLRRGLLDHVFREWLATLDTHSPVPGRACPACRSAEPSLVPLTCPRCQAAWT
jgi:hypothetical protein